MNLIGVIFEVIPPKILLFNKAVNKELFNEKIKSCKKWSFLKVTENVMSLTKYLIYGGSGDVALEKCYGWLILNS